MLCDSKRKFIEFTLFTMFLRIIEVAQQENCTKKNNFIHAYLEITKERCIFAENLHFFLQPEKQLCS